MKSESLSLLLTGLLLYSCTSNKPRHEAEEKFQPVTVEDSIAAALDYQLEHYPSSQYRDIYKNFMQDYFGPGHILTDTAASSRYLLHELSSAGQFEGPLYEPTGYKGNFYRVNLSLIKDSIVPYDIFFTEFVGSMDGIVPPSGEEWMSTWNLIDSVIIGRGVHFLDEENDRQTMEAQFKGGDYVVHHSQRFNDSVHFHYRIISRDRFENVIRPLIERNARGVAK